MLKKSPASLTSSSIDTLSAEVKDCIDKHDDLQQEIDVSAPEPFEFTDEAERTLHDNLHEDILSQLETLTLLASVHRRAKLLTMDIQGLLALDSAVSTRESEINNLQKAKNELCVDVLALPDDSAAQEAVGRVTSLFSDLQRLVASSMPPTTYTSTSPTASTSFSSAPHHSRMAPLNLEIPKFTGDPLQWEAFELSLTSLLKHRADGFSVVISSRSFAKRLFQPMASYL